MRHRQVTQLGFVLLLTAAIALPSLSAPWTNLAAAGRQPDLAPAVAGYDLVRWTVDAGGATAPGGDGYTLGGSCGQPDAAVWSYGSYVLAGGFWGRGLTQTIPAGHRVLLPVVVRSDG